MLSLSSDARCSTPCRFDIGSVDQDLREGCDASLFTSVGRGERSNGRHEGGRPLDLRHRRGSSTSEIHRIAGTATQRPATSLAASARGPCSVTLAARLAGKTAAETISVMLAIFARIK